MAEVLANLATTTLSNNLTSGGLSASVVSTAGFPATGNFRIRIGNEIIVVTTPGSGALGGLQRGAEGTTAAAHSTGDAVRQVMTRDGIAQLISESAGSVDPILGRLNDMDSTHADALVQATAWGLALLLDANAAETKLALGLDQVNNTPDTGKPVSVAQQAAINNVPWLSVTTSRNLLDTDMGKCLDLGGAAASAVTITIPGALNPTVGDWVTIRKGSIPVAMNISTDATSRIRNPYTGTIIGASTSFAVNDYETVRLTYFGLSHWIVTSRSSVAGSSPDISVLKQSPLNIEYPEYGATTGSTNNSPQINAALAAAAGSTSVRGGTVLVPPNREYQIRTPLSIPTGVTLQIEGAVVVDPALASPIAQAIIMKQAGTQGFGGGIRGHGRILCNRKATDAIFIDTWRHGDFRYFEICDPINAGIVLVDTIGTTANGLASDSHHFDHIFLRTDPAAGFATALRPMFFFDMDATGEQMISDSTIINCQVTNGLKPADDSPNFINGGIAVRLTDCQRIKVHDMMISDNTRAYSGGVLIRASASASNTRNSEGNIVDQLYMEAQATSPGANFVNRGVQLLVMTGSAKSINFTEVIGLRGNWGGYVGGKRLVTTNNGTGQIRDNTYTAPRNFLDGINQITLDSGSINNYVELMRIADTTGGKITNADATNKFFALAGTGNPGFVPIP